MKEKLIRVNITQKQNLEYLIDPSFQGVNRYFVSLPERDKHKTVHAQYFFPKAEIKCMTL